jgi:hypothetical protein
MIVRRRTVLHVNLGNYEWVELHAEVEATEQELQGSGDLLQKILDDQLRKDIMEVRESSGLTADKSFIFHWKQETPS